MTTFFSFVGELDDPTFLWDNPAKAKWSGNLPRRVAPAEAFDSLGVDVRYVWRMIREGRHDGRQLDWGSWGLKMTGAEILAFFADTSANKTLSLLDKGKPYVLLVAENA